MIEYKDPIPPVLGLLIPAFGDRIAIYGNTFPRTGAELPAVLVRQTGGDTYFRLQLWARANQDYEAMGALIEVMNYLERNAARIQGLGVMWCQRESNPIPGEDEDTGLPEAWAYLRLEAKESYSMGG